MMLPSSATMRLYLVRITSVEEPIYLPVETLFAMFHWHTNVQKNSMTRIILENFYEHMPRVRVCVIFEEMVEATVTANLSLVNDLFLLFVVRLKESYAGRGVLHTSSSGPTRRLAPWALASNILALMRTRSPSQSSAHRLSEHDAIVTRDNTVANHNSVRY